MNEYCHTYIIMEIALLLTRNITGESSETSPFIRNKMWAGWNEKKRECDFTT